MNESPEKRASLGNRNAQTNMSGLGMIQDTSSSVNIEEQTLSRDELLGELEEMGMEVAIYNSLPTSILADILISLKGIKNVQAGRKGRSARSILDSEEGPPILSTTDKKILNTLLASNGSASSLTLSKNLDIPLSTVQRRRRRLEAKLLDQSYSLKLEKFGLRSASLFVTTTSASTDLIGREILSWDNEVVSVKRCIGENSIDLQVEVIFESNRELLTIIERMKTIEGVTKVSWSEPVKVIGRNLKIYGRAIPT